MSAQANRPSTLLPIVLVIDGSESLVERCRAVMADRATVISCELTTAPRIGSTWRVRAIMVTADAFGAAPQAIGDLARRLCARLIKLPSEQMPDRYIGEALFAAVGLSGVRRRE
jgi:hypothetical protein